MEARIRRRLRALALAFVARRLSSALGAPLHARPRPPACEPGTFVLTEAEGLVPGSVGESPTPIVVDADGSVATASGCPDVAGKLKAGRRGSRLAAKWTRKTGLCTGLARKATLTAQLRRRLRASSRAASRRRGEADLHRAPRRRSDRSGERRGLRRGAARRARERRRGGRRRRSRPRRTIRSRRSGRSSSRAPPGTSTVSGVRYARPAPARYELTLVFAGYAASPAGAVLGGTCS